MSRKAPTPKPEGMVKPPPPPAPPPVYSHELQQKYSQGYDAGYKQATIDLAEESDGLSVAEFVRAINTC